MILYHGTSIENLESILNNGIQSAKFNHINNFPEHSYERCLDLVYVTKTPIQYAVNASYNSGKGVVFELDIPDEKVYLDPKYQINQHWEKMYNDPEEWKRLTSNESLKEIAMRRIEPKSDQYNFCCIEKIEKENIVKYLTIDFRKRQSMCDLMFQEMTSQRLNLSFIDILMNDKDWEKRCKPLTDTGMELHVA